MTAWRQMLATGRRNRDAALQYAWAERRRRERQRAIAEGLVVVALVVAVLLGVMP